jgi:quercetin dioxygenase-like cupin family protein
MTEDNKAENPTYALFANLEELIPEIPSDSIVSRTIHADGEVKTILFGFASGQELSEHTASKPAILHFLSGEAQLSLGGDVYEAQAGTWVHMAAHLPHSVKALTPVAMLLLMLN